MSPRMIRAVSDWLDIGFGIVLSVLAAVSIATGLALAYVIIVTLHA